MNKKKLSQGSTRTRNCYLLLIVLQTEVPSDDSLTTKSKLLQDTGSIIASSLHKKVLDTIFWNIFLNELYWTFHIYCKFVMQTEVPPNDSVVTKPELLQDDTVSTITSSLHEEVLDIIIWNTLLMKHNKYLVLITWL